MAGWGEGGLTVAGPGHIADDCPSANAGVEDIGIGCVDFGSEDLTRLLASRNFQLQRATGDSNIVLGGFPGEQRGTGIDGVGADGETGKRKGRQFGEVENLGVGEVSGISDCPCTAASYRWCGRARWLIGVFLRSYGISASPVGSLAAGSAVCYCVAYNTSEFLGVYLALGAVPQYPFSEQHAPPFGMLISQMYPWSLPARIFPQVLSGVRERLKVKV